MIGPARRVILAAVVVTAGGCLSTDHLRLPQVLPRHPAVEKQSHELLDPYPDDVAGPETGVRPRGWSVPRTEERRAMELRSHRLKFPPGSTPPPQRSPFGLTVPRVPPH